MNWALDSSAIMKPGEIFQGNDGVLRHQFGYWAQVAPEPSVFALLGLGLLALYMKKGRV
jgi:hypothetical protein